MSPRKAVNQELSRESIMEVAREMFLINGYQHVSMRQIGQKLNYSHGAIYYHFKNKAELFYAIVKQDFSLLDDVLYEVMNRPLPSKDKLRDLLLGFIQFGLTHQNHYEIMFLIKDEELRNSLQEAPNQSYEKFAAAICSLSEEKITIKEVWSIFLSLHGFVSHYCRSGQKYEDVKLLAESHVAFILRAMGR